MLIPSIDLQGGRVVQLVQGERLAWSTDDLAGWMEKFSHFPIVQVIDLDAAKGLGTNRDLVTTICRRLPCQVGGGIRSVGQARSMLDAGAKRVIVGSALFDETSVDVAAATAFSRAVGDEQLVAAVDSRSGRVAVRGWQSTIALPVADAMAALEPYAGTFLATLIDGEGRLGGIDMAAARALRQATSRRLIVAGGIRAVAEVDQLHERGMDSVVGMAIYTGVMEIPRPGVIFDFDGVIADSEGQHFRAFQEALAERGWALTESDYYERYLGYSDQELFEMVARERGEILRSSEYRRLVVTKGRAYARLMKSGAALCPGAESAIRRLASTFPLAIASAAFSHEIAEVIDGAGLADCFRAIVGADNVTASKPSPEPYLEAARRLGIPPTACAAIEDSPWGLQSARSAGLRTIGITHTYPRERLTLADVVVDSLDEVTLDLVRQLLRRG